MTQQLTEDQIRARVRERLVDGSLSQDQARTVLEAWKERQQPTEEVSFAQALTGNAPQTHETQMQAQAMGGGVMQNLTGGGPEPIAPGVFSAPELNELSVRAFRAGVGGLLEGNPEEVQQIIASNYPEAEFGEIEGQPAVTLPSGQYLLNPEGIDPLDVARFGTGMAAFTPAGRISGMGRQLAKGAAAAGATQAGIEGAETLAGGEFDAGEIAGAAAMQGAGQTAGEFLSGVLRTATGRMSPEAQQLVQAGERYNVPVLTSDALPPRTYFGKSAQTLFERIPIVGTAGRRALQQEAREGAIQRFASEFGVSPEIPFTDDVIESLNVVKARRWKEAADLKNSAREALSESGDAVPTTSFREAIDEAIKAERSFGSQADESLLRSLQSWRDAPPGTFGFVDDLRSRLGDQISDFYGGQNSQIGKKGVQYLQRMKNALTDDMDRFAERSNNPEAFRNWRRGNQMFQEEYGKFQLSALKGLLDKGEIEPEKVMSVLSGNRPSQSALLYQNLTPQGRASAKGAIIQNMMDRSRNNMGDVDPDRLLTQMRRMDKNLKVFFKGDDEEVLNGFREVLRNTQRASRAELATPTGDQLYYLGLGGGLMANAPATATVVGGASLGRLYETGPVRNAMLRLANTRPGSTQYDRALRNAIDALTAAGQAERQADED